MYTTTILFILWNLLMMPYIEAIPKVAKDTGTEINAYIDKIINEMKKSLIQNGMEPLLLPNIMHEFCYSGLFGVNYRANASLSDGSLSGLVTMYRTGDIEMTYSSFHLHVAGSIALHRMMLQYDFITTLMDIGPKGSVICHITDTELHFIYDMNLLSFSSNITEFVITNNGKLHCKIRGLGYFPGILLEILLNTVISVWNDAIVVFLSSTLQEYMQNVLNNLVDNGC